MNEETISALGGFCTELLSDEAFKALVAAVLAAVRR
jgi:hypothetical protein